jgi:WD40 repeat protein/uncharacterized caspase-like protein
MKVLLRVGILVSVLLSAQTVQLQAQQLELVVQTGHSDEITSVALSADGHTLASGSDDQTIKLWEVATGRELRTLSGHLKSVTSLAFSTDGHTLASGSLDQRIKLWEVGTGRELRTLSGHSHWVNAVVFSADGKTLASGSGDNTIKLWEVATGRELRTLGGHSKSVHSVVFSADGKTLASGSGDKTIKLWEVTTGRELRTLSGHPSVDPWVDSSVASVAFSTDGKMLASASRDNTIKLWEVATGRELRTLSGHSKWINSVVFSADGKTLASGSGDKTIKLWEAATGRELRTLSGHSEGVNSITFNADGKTLASGSGDKTIKLWEVATGRELRTFGRHSEMVRSVALNRDGKTLASHIADNTVKLWDVATGHELRTLSVHSDNVTSVAFSADGKTLASASWDKTIKLWDVATGRELRTLSGHSDQVNSVAFSADGKTLASGSGSDDTTVKLWEVATGRELRTLSGNSSFVNSVAFSADGKTLASGSDKTVKLWEVATGRELRTLSGHSHWIQSVAFSADGKTLASGSWDKTIKLWEVATGHELHTLSGHSSSAYAVFSVAFSGDGKTLASGSDDRMIKLWEVATGRELRTLSGHSAGITSVAFSADGRFLFSGSADASIRLWVVETGEPLARLIALDETDWVVVTPDGRFDTNKNLDSIEGLHWVVSDDPMKALPLEIFMRDYYEPRLLPRLLKCNEEKNCDREFKPVRDISKLNRVQPPVKVANVSPPDGEGYVNVTVQVGKGEGKYLVDGKETTRTTDSYDLRLFRDGQMVGNWPSDGAEKLLKSTSQGLEANGKLSGETRILRELRDWQQATRVQPNDTVKVDPKTGMLTLPSFRVKLPRGKDVSEIDFSAYAFNEDRVKSQTAHWQWSADLKAKLPKAQAVKARAYIVTIGVNAYENPEWNLKYAANDARQIQKTLIEKLNQGGEYQEVVSVSLISDYQTIAGKDEVTEKSATKANIKAVLDRLAGKPVNSESLKNISNGEKLRKAEPDDLIIISFSSHGYADGQGNFYLIPYDVGPGSKREINSDLLRHAISSEELSLWLRDVDAGEMVMVVDACHAAASVKGEGFKPGPMGSRGLGQLSYDKGMRILTSTQSDDVAVETDFTQQGLLSYVLTHDGIQSGLADFKPQDKTITLAEWLDYAVDRVPTLYGEIKEKYQLLALNEIKSLSVGEGGRAKLLIFSRDGSNSSMKKGANQQPSLFDFTRKKRAVVLAKMN